MAQVGTQNYQKEMEKRIQFHEKNGEVPTLLLHSCCGPCSSSVLELVSQFFRVTVLYYNPNIQPEEEYRHRVQEQRRFTEEFPARYPICFMEGRYEPERFYAISKGLEMVPEGGERCRRCFIQRLEKTAKLAKEKGFDYFTTTLTVSPLKNAPLLNEIGQEMGEKYGVTWLPSDFKKKNGYLRSVELSKEYGMYRQDYCGCVYSKAERERMRKAREQGETQAAFVELRQEM